MKKRVKIVNQDNNKALNILPGTTSNYYEFVLKVAV